MSEEQEDFTDYDAHVVRQNTAYALAYEEFEAGLTPEQRAILGRSATPDIEDHHSLPTRKILIGISKDAAESSLASYRPDIAKDIDGIKDELLELGIPKEVVERLAKWHEERVNREAEEAKARVIVKIVGEFLLKTNVKLCAAGLAYSADLALVYGMGSMDAWAKQHGVSRQAVSKVANFWRNELGLPGGSHMRDDKTREAYREAQLTNHWRYKKYGNSPTE
jgi:hypothetical protein